MGVEVGPTALLAFFPAVAIAQVLPVGISGLGHPRGRVRALPRPARRPRPSRRSRSASLLYLLNLGVSLLGAPAFAFGGRVAVRRPRPSPPRPVTALDTASAAAPPRPRLRWWREVVYTVVIYLVYSTVRNQFGSAGGPSGQANRIAYEHALDIIAHPGRRSASTSSRRSSEWYLDLPADGLDRVLERLLRHRPLHRHRRRPHLALPRATRRATRCGATRWRSRPSFALVGFASFSLMPPRLLDETFERLRPAAAARSIERRARLRRYRRHARRLPDVLVVRLRGRSRTSPTSTRPCPACTSAGRCGRRSCCCRWCGGGGSKALIVLHPVATLFCIIVTANHYWLDAVGGLVDPRRRLPRRPGADARLGPGAPLRRTPARAPASGAPDGAAVVAGAGEEPAPRRRATIGARSSAASVGSSPGSIRSQASGARRVARSPASRIARRIASCAAAGRYCHTIEWYTTVAGVGRRARPAGPRPTSPASSATRRVAGTSRGDGEGGVEAARGGRPGRARRRSAAAAAPPRSSGRSVTGRTRAARRRRRRDRSGRDTSGMAGAVDVGGEAQRRRPGRPTPPSGLVAPAVPPQVQPRRRPDLEQPQRQARSGAATSVKPTARVAHRPTSLVCTPRSRPATSSSRCSSTAARNVGAGTSGRAGSKAPPAVGNQRGEVGAPSPSSTSRCRAPRKRSDDGVGDRDRGPAGTCVEHLGADGRRASSSAITASSSAP